MKTIVPHTAETLFVALLAFCLGCEQRVPDAVVKIGDLSLTSAQLNRDTEVCLSAFLSKERPKAASRKKNVPKDIEKLRSRAEAMSLSAEINYMLVSCHAQNQNIEPSADALKKVEDEYSVSYFGKRGRFGELASVLPQNDFKVIGEQVRKLAAVNTFVDRQYADKYRVAEQEIAEAWTNIVAHNKFVDETNACIYATARALVKRARDGEDFTQLADLHSQDEYMEPGGVLLGLHKDDYASDKPGVWTAISVLKPGEVTEPLDSDDGLAIFKLTSISNCQCSGEESSEEKDYHLQRIIFHRALKQPYESADEVAIALKAQRKRQMWRQIIIDLTAENPLSFPNGFDCFSSDSLLMLRAYSKDVPKPKLNKMESLLLRAMKAQQQKHAKEKE